MNKHLLSLCGAAAAFLGVNQSTLADPQTWAQSYGVGGYLGTGKHANDQFAPSGDDYPVGIAKMPDGGVVVAGQVGFPYRVRNGGFGGSMATLVRFAPDGTILWQRTIEIPIESVNTPTDIRRSPSYVYQVASDAQGNIFIC